MSDLSIGVRNMKFMQRTSDSRKKLLKKASLSQTSSEHRSNLNAITPASDYPCLWRIIENENTQKSVEIESITTTTHPSIVYRHSIFSIHERNFTRLSFQNFNKRLEPLMMKYGLKQELKHLEDGEIDPNDDHDDTNNNNNHSRDEKNDENESIDIEKDRKPTSTLVQTLGKKLAKKSISRPKFDNKTSIKKRRRRLAKARLEKINHNDD